MKRNFMWAPIAIVVIFTSMSSSPGGNWATAAGDLPREKVVATFSKGSGDAQIGISDPMPEVEPYGPNALMVDAQGVFYVLDSINHRLLSYNPANKDIGLTPLPDGIWARDVIQQGDSFYVRDDAQRTIFKLDASGALLGAYPVPDDLLRRGLDFVVTPDGAVRWQVDGHQEYTLQPLSELDKAEPLAQTWMETKGTTAPGSEAGDVRVTSSRTDDSRGTLTLLNANGATERTLDISVEHYLGSARLIQMDGQGNAYVLVEELLKDVPAFVVDATVRQYDAKGQLTGIARVPIDSIYALPYRFVAIGPDGTAYFLHVAEMQVEILQLAYVTNYQPDLESQWIETQREMTDQLEANHATVTDAQPASAQGTITRDQIMQNAESYLHVGWILGQNNYRDGDTSCWDDSVDDWSLPGYLIDPTTGQIKVNQRIEEMPYSWGGHDSIDSFRAGISSGKLAGNACTRRSTALPGTVGVDCGGFVGEVWQPNSSYPGFSNISTRINWNDLRPGDMAWWPNHHVILFVSFQNGSNIDGGINTIEAAAGCNWKVCGRQWRYTSLSVYTPYRFNGVNEIPNQPPSTPTLVGPANNTWLTSNTVTLSWNASTDDGLPGSGLTYQVEIWQPGLTWRMDGYGLTGTSWAVTIPDGANYNWHVRASDGALSGAWSETRVFSVDANPPAMPAITIRGAGCVGIQNNDWQATCYDPSFSFSAVDAGSGVKGFLYAWGITSTLTPSTFIAATTFDPPAFAAPGSAAQRYFNLRARDNFDRDSGMATFGVLYDSAAPTLTVSINNGAPTANQVDVRLFLSTGDVGSGVKEVRFSNNSIDWSNWQPLTAQASWWLPALNRRTLAVYAQARDGAGNISNTASDNILLDLYPPMPNSANYRICQNVVDAGGSRLITSTNYHLASAIGQPSASGGTPISSTGFNGQFGFLGSITGCLPITYTTTSLYTITQWVVASGGNVRGSASFRLGDTAGQPSASGAARFTSASYFLSSGFWAAITGTIPPATTPPTPLPLPTPTPSPTPGPTPTPLPAGFGVSINNGALYTNDPNVTVSLSAPNVAEMRLSSDGGYTNDNWRSFQITAPWTITTTVSYVLPRLVYVWFRDQQRTVYGSFVDDILYDPVPPTGYIISIPLTGTLTHLELEAWDDLSGVSAMRLAESHDMVFTTEWLPYQPTLTYTLSAPGNIVYVQYKDLAGNESFVYDTNLRDISIHEVYLPLILR